MPFVQAGGVGEARKYRALLSRGVLGIEFDSDFDAVVNFSQGNPRSAGVGRGCGFSQSKQTFLQG